MIRRCIAEALGTMAIVFFGCGSAITLASQGAVAHISVNAAFGLVVAVMIYALGPISGAHFNPAVSIGLASGKHFPWREVPAYLASQVAGAMLGSGLHWLTIRSSSETVSYGATLPQAGIGPAFVLETVMTFMFMLVIISVATDLRTHRAVPGLAIGMMVAVCGLFAGPLTGNSLNPARSLAPAIFAGGVALSSVWIYLIAPPLGAVLAVQLYRYLRSAETAD